MNSEEIARLAKVSRSTVSRVINNYPNVPEHTRKKVQAIIDQYGYKPNASARILAGKANNIIGIFIGDIESDGNRWSGINSPYNMELVVNLIHQAKQRGYLTLVDVVTNVQDCKEMEHYFSNRMIYGGIFVGFPYRAKELEMLAKDKHNIVLIDQLTNKDDVNNEFKTVNTDNIKGGYISTKHLIDLGHKKIAHISGDNRLSSVEREIGYRDALNEAGILYRKEYVIQGYYKEDIAYKKTIELLKKHHPTAIFVANDIMALGVVKAIEDSGLEVPKDISVVGFDSLKQSQWLDLQLTSAAVNLKEVASEAVSLVLEKESNNKHRLCDLSITIGKTTIENK